MPFDLHGASSVISMAQISGVALSCGLSVLTFMAGSAYSIQRMAEIQLVSQAAEMPDRRSAEGHEGREGHAGQPVENTQAAEVPECRSAEGHEGHAGHAGQPLIEEAVFEGDGRGVGAEGARALAGDRIAPDGNHGDNLREVQQ